MKTKKVMRKVLLVTGLSGAGLSTALKSLEDMGYKAIDNLPLALVEKLLAQKEGRRTPVAIGIDSRTWDFSAAKLVEMAAKLRRRAENDLQLVFIDCQDELLQQRFTETRRVHPLAQDRPVRDGVARERQMMRAVKQAADHVIDTSGIKAAELRRLLGQYFQLDRQPGLQISVTSFGYKNGLPRESDLVFDVRFLDNPFWNAKLRPLSGRDAAVADHVRKDSAYEPFFDGLSHLLSPLLPRYDREGKHYLTIAVGCTGGRHRSVCIAEDMGKWLLKEGYSATVRHRDMDKWAQEHNIRHDVVKKDVKSKAKRKKA